MLIVFRDLKMEALSYKEALCNTNGLMEPQVLVKINRNKRRLLETGYQDNGVQLHDSLHAQTYQ